MDCEDLLRKLWQVTGMERPETRPTIRLDHVERPDVISQVQALVPYLRIHFPVARHRCLVTSGWENAKKPVLNLLRQIVRTLGYKIVPIPGDAGSYIVIPVHEKDTPLPYPRRSSEDLAAGGPHALRVRHDIGLNFY